MANLMLVMSNEEVKANIAYSLICFARYGSAWNTGRRRRAWMANFTEDERRAAGRLFRQTHDWTVGRGVPDKVTMSMETFRLWQKLAEFCASI